MTFLSKAILPAMAVLFSLQTMAADITLPAPQTTGGMPLMDTIKARRSTREMAPDALDAQTISNILWSAYGISSDKGLRTIPTALNKQDLTVYALTADGAFRYDAADNKLVQISETDLRPIMGERQAYAAIAPLTLVFTGNGNPYDGMHAGSAYQNASLYCVSAGLNHVVRGAFDKDKIKAGLKLPTDEQPIISLTIGKKPA